MVGKADFSKSDLESGLVKGSLPIIFTEPFTWITVKLKGLNDGDGEPESDPPISRLRDGL
jgi:hypothetical protein